MIGEILTYMKELGITFLDFINSIEFFKILLQSGLLIFLIQFLSSKLKYNQDQKLKEIEKNNTKEIQREAFYRNQNGDELRKLVEEYTLVITDPSLFGKAKDNKVLKKNATDADNKKHVTNLMGSLIIYGSEEAILIASLLMQDIYSSEETEKNPNTEEKNQNIWMKYWLAAKLVAQLKSDYTGIEVEPMDIFKLKINDLYKVGTIEIIEDGKNKAEELIKNEQNKRKN